MIKDYSLPFDQFSRQYIVYDLLNSQRSKGETYKILDIGGYKGATNKIHKEDTVTVLDLFDVKEDNYVKGSALDMPFTDHSFDIVMCFDVFEHIDNKDRERFVKEANRVASKMVIIAAPVGTKENVSSEEDLNNMFKKLHGKNHPWLIEHIDYGLPEVGQAKKEMESVGMDTIVVSSNDTVLWSLMQTVIFINSKVSDKISSIDKINEYYNKNINYDGTSDILESYRHIIFGFKNKSDLKRAQKYINNISNENNFSNRIKVIQKINNHYSTLINELNDINIETRKLFLKKIEEKDLLLKTIDNISEERDKFSRELEEIKKMNVVRISKKIAKFNSKHKRS